VELGVDVQAVDLEGRTAADVARYDSVVSFLTEEGTRR